MIRKINRWNYMLNSFISKEIALNVFKIEKIKKNEKTC